MNSKTELARVKRALKTRKGPSELIVQDTVPRDAKTDQAVMDLFTKKVAGLADVRTSYEKILAAENKRASATLAKARSAALKVAKSRTRDQSALVARRVGAFETAVAKVVTANVERHLIKAPFEISGFPLDGWESKQNGSYARFKINQSNGYGEGNGVFRNLVFKFLWVNELDRYVIIDIHGYLVLHGYFEAGCGGGFFGGSRYASFSVKHSFDVLDYTRPVGTGAYGEPLFPVLARSPETTVVDMRAESGGWFSNGELKWDSIYRGYDLEHRLLVVEPGKTLGFNMNVKTTTATGKDSGRVFADFSTDPYRVTCTDFLVAVLS